MPGRSRRGGRLSDDWTMIGFQGRDPATDFRGMGVLGLHQVFWRRGSASLVTLI